jgi:hypothetical protein
MINLFEKHEDIQKYDLFCRKVAYRAYTETGRILQEFPPNIQDLNEDYAMHFGRVMGIPMREEVEKITKDFDREQLIDYLTTAISAHMINQMNHNPQFKAYIVHKGPFNE